MKRIQKKWALLLVGSVIMTFSVSAQAYLEDPKWGNSPEERKANVLKRNYFNDAFNNKDYNRAANLMHELIGSAPKSSPNLYLQGITIYRTRIAESASAADKQANLDTLMWLYDRRAEHFGDDAQRGTPYILGLKARDYMVYSPADVAGAKAMVMNAIEAAPSNPDLELITLYFNAVSDQYKNDKIGTDQYLAEYDAMSALFEQSSAADKDAAKKTFDQLFINSGAASCENLEKVFGPQLAADPSDLTLLNKVFRLLAANECTSDFQIEVSEKLYAAEPSTAIALMLAAGFENRNELDKARQYLNEAIKTETDPSAKANLAVRIAGTELQGGNARSAAEYARQAIEIDPNNGYAYVILANAYVSGSGACSGFDRQAAYWLIVDTLGKAKSLLPAGDPQMSSIDSQIGSFRAAFPSNEDAFFRGLENGQGYTVSCGWVSGRTTVRTK